MAVQRERDDQGRARNARPRDGFGRPLPRGAEGVPRVPDDLVLPPLPSLVEAQRLLDAGMPFHAHEVLEATWKAAPGSADAKSIESRLGWLDVGSTMKPHMDAVHRLREQVRDEKFEAVYLLGMGGSSLCAEVLRAVFGVAATVQTTSSETAG